MKKIVCLFGGPGSGKSTVAGGLFFFSKMFGFEAELNREYVKEWVWEKRNIKSGDQTYFFSKMARRERIYMESEIDLIITDSPLILTHFYGLRNCPYERRSNTSLNMLKNHHEICKDLGYKVEHYFLARKDKYSEKGRFQTHKEAIEIDKELKDFLDSMGIKYKVVGRHIHPLFEILCDLMIDKLSESKKKCLRLIFKLIDKVTE